MKYWRFVVLLILTLSMAAVITCLTSYFNPQDVRNVTGNFFGLLLFVEIAVWRWKTLASVHWAVIKYTVFLAGFTLVYNLLGIPGGLNEKQQVWFVIDTFIALGAGAYIYFDVFWVMLKGRYNLKVKLTQTE